MSLMKNELSLPAIPKEELDRNCYTVSVLSSGARHKILPPERLACLKRQFTAEFVENAQRYTLRASSSVPVPAAQRIAGSLLFHSDVYLLSLGTAENAARALSAIDFPELIGRGQALVWQYFQEAKRIQRAVRGSMLTLPIWVYRRTGEESFEEFAAHYDFRYGAQEVPASIDYPLLFETRYTGGVLYMREYLSHLKLENELCSRFPPSEIDWLFRSLARQTRVCCEDLFVNIAEVVLINALCAALLNKPVLTLRITAEECADLQRQVSLFSAQDCKRRFSDAMKRLLALYGNHALRFYIRPFAGQAAEIVYRKSANQALAGYVIAAD